MNLRAELNKRIEKKKAEIASLENDLSLTIGEIETAQSVLLELQPILKLLPKEDGEGQNEPQVEMTLRRGSDVWKCREVLRKVRAPMHVNDLLKGIEKPVTTKNAKSLAGQLAWYARKEQIFTRPEPATFGLKEWESKKVATKPETLQIGTPTIELHAPADGNDVIPVSPPLPPDRSVQPPVAVPLRHPAPRPAPLPPRVRSAEPEIDDEEIPF